MDKLTILFTASEVVPFAKTGGLADVSGALPKALKALGHDVRVVMPRYYLVDKEKYGLHALEGALGVPMGFGEEWALVLEGRIPHSDVPIYFIEHEGYFGRKGLYDEGGDAYRDNAKRFVFFSKAVMQLAKKLHWQPDIIHANDWHTALLPLLRNSMYVFDGHFSRSATVLTIHNLQHQGRFGKEVMDYLGVSWQHYNTYELEDFDGVNFLKAGIVHANAVTTVSPTYAQEIKGPAFDWGLKEVINAHAHKLHGVLNGIDYDEWNPANDPYIAQPFSADVMDGKALCKADLQRTFGLPVRDDVPILGFVGRMVNQKGITLLAEEIWNLLHLDVQIIMLGTGEAWAEHYFSHVATHRGDKFACYIGYRNDLAHKIEAGSDFFLMPSLFEPCGLNQLYSMAYGTLPIVRATGGLEDTVENFDHATGSGTGFKFYDATPQALFGTIVWAVDVWNTQKEAIEKLIQNAMRKHYGWDGTAKIYEAIYRQALDSRFNH